jgi:uncharacterized cupin superfamily protein
VNRQVTFSAQIRHAIAGRPNSCGIWQNFPNQFSEFHEPREICRFLEVPVSTQPECFYFVLVGT